jgi:hypothetical protein
VSEMVEGENPCHLDCLPDRSRYREYELDHWRWASSRDGGQAVKHR